ncbi:hypothetical protein BGW41_000999 [Actinomortierella wolfii]|nr:hypothetical protein BGW41_000999 [Actinomortierella wolfii]
MLPSLSVLPLIALCGAAFFGITTTPALAAPEETIVPSPNGPRLRCKCLPDQPCWPSSATWSAFNQTVGGRLITTRPVARECHPPYYDQAKCDEIKKGYYFEHWRQLQPGAVQYTNWETVKGQGCLLNQTTPCVQGAVPLFSINASSIADVQETVRFAARHNIRLVVKNTGHDFLGRSTAASSINLWVYFMKQINVLDAFVPEGAPDGTEAVRAVALEAGVVWQDAYKAVDAHQRTVAGGAAQTVGTSGGYCLSGGHGPLSPLVGLCVDNVLQYKVVTADGEVRIANAYQNKDLFWAMRGGGPGFGVVVEAVYRTHPIVPISYVFLTAYSETPDQLSKVVHDFYRHQAQWSDDGWSGYGTVARNYMVLTYLLANNSNLETAKASFHPFVEYAQSVPNVTIANLTYTQFPSFYAYFDNMSQLVPGENAAFDAILGSRLVPRSMFDSAQGVDQLASTMTQIQTDTETFSDHYLTLLVAGGKVTKGSSTETSVHPAWRKALMFIISAGGWYDDTPYKEQVGIQQAMTKAIDRLRTITPGSGTYQNEADPNEPNFQQNFFGANYPRLKSIKNKYDPHGLFVCRRCVGSDDWNSDEMCPRRR